MSKLAKVRDGVIVAFPTFNGDAAEFIDKLHPEKRFGYVTVEDNAQSGHILTSEIGGVFQTEAISETPQDLKNEANLESKGTYAELLQAMVEGYTSEERETWHAKAAQSVAWEKGERDPRLIGIIHFRIIENLGESPDPQAYETRGTEIANEYLAKYSFFSESVGTAEGMIDAFETAMAGLDNADPDFKQKQRVIRQTARQRARDYSAQRRQEQNQ